MDFDLKDWWQEITGYGVGACAWIFKALPGDCEGWTHLFALLIVAFTFLFITLPKAWKIQKKIWFK